jgi:uncharacterized membrane protein
MTLYELFLLLHVFSAIIWLGAGFVFTLLLALARRANDEAKEASYHADIDVLAPVLFIPAAMATFIFGLLSAIEGNWDFGQAWILIGLAGWLLSFLIGILYFKPESERIAALSEQGDAGMTEAMTRSKRMTAVDNFELTTLYVVAAAMVLKPTGEDPGILIAFAAILGLVLFVNFRAIGGATADTAPAPTNP